jgi:hypothetical protein
MSGETLEDYFRRLNLDDTRRNYFENIKEGKQEDKEIQEQYFKIAEQHSLIAEERYSTYMKRFVIQRYTNRPLTIYKRSHIS